MKSKNKTKSISLSIPEELAQKAKRRAKELDMSITEYVRHLVGDDLAYGGPMKIRVEVSEPADDAEAFMSFSATKEFEQVVNKRSVTLGISRSKYLRSLMQKDIRAGGDIVLLEGKSSLTAPRSKKRYQD